jgi:hypothetical protein
LQTIEIELPLSVHTHALSSARQLQLVQPDGSVPQAVNGQW